MFLNNKYTKWYFNIINAAKSRILVGYVERHHIIPRSFFVSQSKIDNCKLIDGNPNDSENLVCLTAKEHFICHLLLTKMTEGIFKKKMYRALNAMCNMKNKERYRCTSSIYEYSRKQYSIEQSKSMLGKNNHMFNRIHSTESRQKMSISHKGKIVWNTGKSLTESHKKKISASLAGENNPMFGKTHSIESRRKISKSKVGKSTKNKGVLKSELTKQKISLSLSGRSFSETHKQKLKEIPKVVCEFCGKLTSPSMHSRWHGTNCKFKPTN